MAQQMQTLFVDDIDGSEAEGTVRFGLDAANYEIDLSVEHREELHKILAAYIAHARKISAVRRSARGRRGARAAGTHKAREWAREQGIDIKDRGRVPAHILEQYRQAMAR